MYELNFKNALIRSSLYCQFELMKPKSFLVFWGQNNFKMDLSQINLMINLPCLN